MTGQQSLPNNDLFCLDCVPGFRIGHAHNLDALTGCTVIIAEDSAVGGVDQRGGSPGTRETDLLRPMHMVEKVNAVLLTGGSAFGLNAAAGVMQYLEERKLGFNTGVARVPIVPAAVLFDLVSGLITKWVTRPASMQLPVALHREMLAQAAELLSARSMAWQGR